MPAITSVLRNKIEAVADAVFMVMAFPSFDAAGFFAVKAIKNALHQQMFPGLMGRGVSVFTIVVAPNLRRLK
ncbi:hypothetical protein [Agrobacterium vitis]|uniref:hypothetical protein n=1 Tax=Agrobacterium vitis TaxID=373 RepID=UPI001573E410|nr:hypothetical protein [Agrobacterium vitis]NSZ16930.1 hypothetical protein [Agrobacterium vitis]QZO05838.1 hypothetical protein K4831_09310 [Agrobacterium vitis]UJL86452.1 hypothetical protein AVF2S5_07650 [Agrobacterium vitis]